VNLKGGSYRLLQDTTLVHSISTIVAEDATAVTECPGRCRIFFMW